MHKQIALIALISMSVSQLASAQVSTVRPDTITLPSVNMKKESDLYGSNLISVNVKGADARGNVFEKRILTERQGNKLMFEGDIIIDTLQLQDLEETQGLIHSNTSRRWPDGIVPYEFATNVYTEKQLSRIQEAMRNVEVLTDVQFIERTTEVNYVYIEADGGCSSYVGMVGGAQSLSLVEGCFSGATAEHELFHALGVWHEQSRADRDSYVEILYENIEQGMEYNFEQNITDGEDIGEYDYLSIMHYDKFEFSINGEPTIVRRDNPTLPVGGEEITEGDKQTLRAIYGEATTNTFTIKDVTWVEYIPGADHPEVQGFVRFTNSGPDAVDIMIQAIDETGNYGTSAFLTVPSYATVPVNSDDLESGNESKGLTGGFGDGQGAWRLEVFANGTLDIAGYIRTSNGFLTSMNSIAPSETGVLHTVPIFNPGSNTSKVSKLRLINIIDQPNTFTISGIDDAGNESPRQETITVKGRATVEITAQELEQGGRLFENGIGDGAGKWRLTVTSDKASRVINMMELEGGYISNLSASGNGKNLASRLYCTDIDGASIFSDETNPQYLGFFGSALAENSVVNEDTHWGDPYNYNGIVSNSSPYGNSYGDYSHRNSDASNPPVVVKSGRILFRLSTNTDIDGIYTFDSIKDVCTFTTTRASARFE